MSPPDSADPAPSQPRGGVTFRDAVALVARGALLLALLAFVAMAVVGQDAPLEVGKPAPRAHLVSYDGRGWDLRRFEGRPVLVNFWATWCAPCVAEIPTLASASQRFREDVVFVGATVDSPPAEVFAMIERHGVRYPVAQAHPEMVRSWKASSLPSTYLLDEEHRVVWARRGAVSADDLADAIREGLSGVAAPGR